MYRSFAPRINCSQYEKRPSSFQLRSESPDEDPRIVSRHCFCRKRGSCNYAAVQEAARFRAEALGGGRPCGEEGFFDRKMKRSRMASSSSGAWDCGSALYDSFELDSFSNQFGRRLVESDDRSHLPLLGSPRERKQSCLPFLSIPGNIFPISSCFQSSNSCAIMAFPPEFLREKMKAAQFRKAFRKLLKTAAAAKFCFNFDCYPRSFIVCENNDDPRRPKRKYEHLHHHFHHHVHHYSSFDKASRLSPADKDHGEAHMATANLLKHFHEESSYDLTPQTVAALHGQIDHHQ